MTNVNISVEQVNLIQSAEKIIAPLVRDGVFEDFERALRALLLDYIERNIIVYKEKNAAFEARHRQSFDSFTGSLKGQATPEQEEEWMDWETVLVFLKKWQSVREQVMKNGVA